MKGVAVYEVVGHRRFRGHLRGTVFEAQLDPLAERRAINRGDIRLIRRINLAIQPGTYTLPDGWLIKGGVTDG